jgi:alkaline phosphatase D
MPSVVTLNRRRLLQGTAATLTTMAMPAISRAADRPLLTHGLQSGDVSGDGAVLWARADRPSRALFEVATTDSFRNIAQTVWVDVLPESDFTTKVAVSGCRPIRTFSIVSPCRTSPSRRCAARR